MHRLAGASDAAAAPRELMRAGQRHNTQQRLSQLHGSQCSWLRQTDSVRNVHKCWWSVSTTSVLTTK